MDLEWRFTYGYMADDIYFIRCFVLWYLESVCNSDWFMLHCAVTEVID